MSDPSIFYLDRGNHGTMAINDYLLDRHHLIKHQKNGPLPYWHDFAARKLWRRSMMNLHFAPKGVPTKDIFQMEHCRVHTLRLELESQTSRNWFRRWRRGRGRRLEA